MTEHWRKLGAALLLAGAFACARAQGADGAGIVTQVQGSARAGQQALALLDSVRPGTTLELAAGAVLVLFDARQGRQTTLTGPGRFQAGANGVARLDGSGSLRAERQPAALGAALARRSGAVLAGAVMRAGAGPSDGGIERIAPSRAVFDWPLRPHRGPWRVRLLDDAGQVLHEAAPAQAPLQLPPDVRLQPGRQYVRELRWQGRDGAERLEVQALFTLDASEDAELAALVPGPDAAPAARVLSALYLRSLGVHALARQVAPELDQQENR